MLGPDGLPAANARIAVTTEGGWEIWGWQRPDSDGQGRLRHQALAPGRYRVTATRRGEVSEPVSLRIDSGTDTEVELLLEK